VSRPKKNLIGPGGVRIELDPSQVFLDDPGAGTPAMVYLPFGRGSGTYWCACDTGEVDGEPLLTDRQVEWLNEQNTLVNDYLYPEAK
jgi:hypothetical protein